MADEPTELTNTEKLDYVYSVISSEAFQKLLKEPKPVKPLANKSGPEPRSAKTTSKRKTA